jgi:hypothetical protein
MPGLENSPFNGFLNCHSLEIGLLAILSFIQGIPRTRKSPEKS